MTNTFAPSINACTYSDARDAIEALSAFEAQATEDLAYELLPVFNHVRDLVGFQVRIKDLDGFAVGYV